MNLNHRKFYRFCLFILLVTLFWVVANPGFAQDKKTYTLGWEEWSPFQYKDQNGRITGLDMDLIKAIFAVSNIKLEFVEVPWKRHLKEVKEGRIDLASGASITPEREVYAYFSEPYRSGGAVLFIKKSDKEKWKFNQVSDLEKSSFKLCLTRGYHYGDEIERLKASSRYKDNVGEVTNESQCYMMLKKGYVDGFLADAISGTANLKKEGMINEVEIILNVYSDESHLMFSKNSTNRNIVNVFNRNLATIKKNGRYHEIMGRYLTLKTDKVAEKEKEKVIEQKKQEVFADSTEGQKKQADLLKAYNSMTMQQNLQLGKVGEDIKKLQTILSALGYYSSEINGFFSTELAKSVREFQNDNNLISDGIVGPVTYRALLPYLK